MPLTRHTVAFSTYCSLSVTDLGEPASTMLQCFQLPTVVPSLSGFSLRRFTERQLQDIIQGAWQWPSFHHEIVPVSLCVVGECVSVQFRFLDDFGRVRHVQDKKLQTKKWYLWHPADKCKPRLCKTQTDLPCRYEQNHWSAIPWIVPNCHSRQSISRS